MLETLLKILKESDAAGWRVIQEKIQGWEYYFIRHQLDQNRAKEVEHVDVTVYCSIEDGKYLGMAAASVAPTATEQELRKTVSDLIFQASLVKNKPFELNERKEAEPMEIRIPSLKEEAGKFIRTYRKVKETETENINSYEIFTNLITRRLITSTGIDVTESYPSSMNEVVVNARREGHEIELYRLYHSGTCDSDGLKKEIEDTLRYGKDRLAAVPTPDLGHTAVLFSTDAALHIYRYFLSNLNAAFVCRGMSSFEIGKPVADEIRGDCVTIKACRYLPNSNTNFAYDAEGAPVMDCTLIENSVPVRYWGNRMFSQYLQLRDSFSVTNWTAEGGTRSEEDLRKEDYLEVVEFSDFQVDVMTGDIFGEIRLAYLHKDGKTIPVTGGSVSGDVKECLKDMYMSGETKQYNNAVIPAVTLLHNVTVTGTDAE